MKEEIKQRALEEVENLEDKMIQLATYLHRHPELGHQEYKALKLLTEELDEAGFQVERGLCGMETSFLAEYAGKDDGPGIGIIAEYDALPMGHACGHNLIGASSVGAALALSRVIKDLPGRILVYGTPAEESGGGKIPFCEEGLFQRADVAMLVHPGDRTGVEGTSLAIDALEFTFHGRAAHAAASPEEGINALDGVLLFFNGINALRQQLSDGVRIHGIITEGGEAPNIIPELASCQFYVRALERGELDEVVEKVLCCAEGAARASLCKLEHRKYQHSYENLKTNSLLAEVFTRNLVELGEEIADPPEMMGSTDMGNVSHILPSIHPEVAIAPLGCAAHTREFLEAACSEAGFRGMMQGARAMVMTAIDLIMDPALMERIREEFESE